MNDVSVLSQARAKPETCPSCNRYTERGRQELAIESRSRPIYETDFSKPLSELIENIRSQMARSRGQLSDIGSGFTGWSERVEDVQGLLTCGISALYNVRQEMIEHEKRNSVSEARDEG